MTVRVALAAFTFDLRCEGALGDDGHGRVMRNAYRAALSRVTALLTAST